MRQTFAIILLLMYTYLSSQHNTSNHSRQTHNKWTWRGNFSVFCCLFNPCCFSLHKSMTEDSKVITYLQESLALTSFLYPPLSASWSLIHLNLILIASSAVGKPGGVVSLTVKLAFLQKHFGDGENSGKYGLNFSWLHEEDSLAF